jgi:RNA polymerase sigma-70 factor (family 1)
MAIFVFLRRFSMQPFLADRCHNLNFFIINVLLLSFVPVEPLYNERNLLQQISQGDEASFQAIYDRYKGKLYSYILRIADSRESAEDAVHDVFLKIWDGREKLPEVRNFGAYLFRTARNHAISGFRRMAKETLILAELGNEPVPTLHTIDPITQKEIRTFIQEAVAKLSPQQRKVFMLSRHDGLRHEEISEKLGISIHTVRAHLGEALRFLREEIGRSYGSQAVAIYVIYQFS